MDRIPTTKQAATLRALATDPTTKVAAAALASLRKNEWVEADTTVPTHWGLGDASRREALDYYNTASAEERRAISVHRRARGKRAWGASRSVASGREVWCRDCFEITGVVRVWHTNEGGTEAQRAAEINAGKHMLAHVSGELPALKAE